MDVATEIETLDPVAYDYEFISELEVYVAIQKLKNYKSAGNSYVTGELVRELGKCNYFVEYLTFMFNHICRSGLPNSWNKLKLTSLFKGKGDSTLATNYRGLCIMNTIPKLYAIVLNEKVREATVQLQLRAPT